jgi:hypothetical protein
MAARKSEPSQLERDAAEFGIGVRCGGWRLGLLVARNVEPGTAGRPTEESRTSAQLTKVSGRKFAEMAGVSARSVDYYYKAWDLAAQAGLVPKADQIAFGDDEVAVDIDSIEVEDNPRTQWGHFYGLAKNPPKEKEKKKEPEKPSTPTEVDKDFGIVPEPTVSDEDKAEADAKIIRNELLEILESVRGLQSRLQRLNPADEAKILNEIGSAAMDLSTTAMALGIEKEKADGVPAKS